MGPDRGDNDRARAEQMEGTMPASWRFRTDPWWDVEGRGVKRERLHRRIVGGLAFVVAVAACGLTAAAWVSELTPLFQGLAW